MIYRGIVKGNTIELEQPLPYSEGESVSVSVEPLATQFSPGSPAAILRVMRELPSLNPEAVDELERAIEQGKLPVRTDTAGGSGVFSAGGAECL